MQDIYRMIGVLGSLRASAASHVWGLPYLQDETTGIEEVTKLLQEREGVELMVNYLGLELPSVDPVIKHPVDHDNLSKTLIENCSGDDPLSSAVADLYGDEARWTFILAQLFVTAKVLAQAFGTITLAGLSRKRRTILKEQRDMAAEFFTGMGTVIPDESKNIGGLSNDELDAHVGNMVRRAKTLKATPRGFRSIDKLTEPVVNCLVPDFPSLAQRLKRTMDLRKQLLNCPPGIKDWRSYEDICLKILRFVFVPPFRMVMTQVRNSDGHERRDAVLPNDQYQGFWAAVRNEFDSRHIVCEFKNLKSKFRKSDLHQLRIYLSKPTIGRFGLLFLRGAPSASLKKAQRDAYEQAKILILMLDDRKVEDLMFSRCFFGNGDFFLEREKVSFEVHY